jgi:hypothetical protein
MMHAGHLLITSISQALRITKFPESAIFKRRLFLFQRKQAEEANKSSGFYVKDAEENIYSV